MQIDTDPLATTQKASQKPRDPTMESVVQIDIAQKETNAADKPLQQPDITATTQDTVRTNGGGAPFPRGGLRHAAWPRPALWKRR